MKKYLLSIFALLAMLSAGLAGTMTLLHIGLAGSGIPNLITPVMEAVQLPTVTTGAVSEFGTVVSSTAVASTTYATSSIRVVPLPFDGTVSNLLFHLGTAINSSGSVTITDFVNLSLKTVGCSTTAGGLDCNSGALSDHALAGSSFEWRFTPSSTSWNQSSTLPSNISWTYTADNGQHAALFIQPNNSSGIATTTEFLGFASTIADTNANADQMACPICGYTINGMYVIPNHTETGTPHTYTIFINDSSTGITCQAATSPNTAGCCVNSTGTGTIGGTSVACGTITPIHVAAGSVVAVQVTGTGSTATVQPGISMDVIPDTQNVVPAWGINKSQGAGFQAVAEEVGISATQNNYTMASVGITLSNLQICAAAAVTGAQTRTATIQTGATPGTAPTTPGTTLQAQINSSSTACPGAMSGTYLQSASDTNAAHNIVLAAGQTVDNAYTIASAPATTAIKYSMAMMATGPPSSPFIPLIDLFSAPSAGAVQ